MFPYSPSLGILQCCALVTILLMYLVMEMMMMMMLLIWFVNFHSEFLFSLAAHCKYIGVVDVDAAADDGASLCLECLEMSTGYYY